MLRLHGLKGGLKGGLVVLLSVLCSSANAEATNSVEAWLRLQTDIRRVEARSAARPEGVQAEPVPAEVAERVYQQYLDSFQKPVTPAVGAASYVPATTP
jgi:hypothetical protein